MAGIKWKRNMSNHSLISPSMLSRMFQCEGSVLASVGYPDTSSPAAEHGTMLHGIAEEVLRIGFTDASTLEASDWEMVQNYCAYVKDYAGPGAHLYIEHNISLEQYVTDMRGSVDALIVSDEAIHVIDLAKEIYVHIWQPGNVNHFHVSEEELTKFSERLVASADIALAPNAPLNPSESACRFCKAAPDCPALYQNQLEIVGGDFADLTIPEKLTDEQIATVVLNRSKVEKWMNR